MGNQIYYIGGGTCCGKTSIANVISKKHRLKHYKLDNHLEKYMKVMADRGNKLAKRTLKMNNEQMWMRDPEAMCDDEISLYRAMFKSVEKALGNFGNKNIVADGAGLMPELMAKIGVDKDRYICIVPTREFQFENYSERKWIKHYLSNTSDPEKAFQNWMDRDSLFSEKMTDQARTESYEILTVDGKKSIEENVAYVEGIFGLVTRQDDRDDKDEE